MATSRYAGDGWGLLDDEGECHDWLAHLSPWIHRRPQHEDVHRLLYDLAVSVGAEVIFNAQVTAVTPGEPKPSVTLASGEVYTADIVLGADGPNSLVRETVLADDIPEGAVSGYSVLGAIIPGDAMSKDSELAPWLAADEVCESLAHSVLKKS